MTNRNLTEKQLGWYELCQDGKYPMVAVALTHDLAAGTVGEDGVRKHHNHDFLAELAETGWGSARYYLVKGWLRGHFDMPQNYAKIEEKAYDGWADAQLAFLTMLWIGMPDFHQDPERAEELAKAWGMPDGWQRGFFL